MYGHRRYGRTSKPVEQPTEIDPASIPTYLCGHCRAVKTTNNPYIELTVLENGKLFMYTKICKDCSKLLQGWMKK